MIIIPAIDLLDGNCVRLYKGKINETIKYNKDPIQVAKDFEEMGVERIHIIDLNGAIEGKRKNDDIIIARMPDFIFLPFTSRQKTENIVVEKMIAGWKSLSGGKKGKVVFAVPVK